jgi:hypothetical protein
MGKFFRKVLAVVREEWLVLCWFSFLIVVVLLIPAYVKYGTLFLSGREVPSFGIFNDYFGVAGSVQCFVICLNIVFIVGVFKTRWPMEAPDGK